MLLDFSDQTGTGGSTWLLSVGLDNYMFYLVSILILSWNIMNSMKYIIIAAKKIHCLHIGIHEFSMLLNFFKSRSWNLHHLTELQSAWGNSRVQADLSWDFWTLPCLGRILGNLWSCCISCPGELKNKRINTKAGLYGAVYTCIPKPIPKWQPSKSSQ